MKLGLKQIREYFSNFRWFDQKTVRAESELNLEEKKYIKGWSISPFGFGYPFYIAIRKLPDIFTVYVVTYIYFEITDRIVNFESLGDLATLILGLLTFIMFVVSIAAYIFTFRHGRRLSWNRGRYIYSWKTILQPKLESFKSVDDLKKSERRFVKYNVLPSLIFLIIVLIAIIGLNIFS